jgi:hypothetical protein
MDHCTAGQLPYSGPCPHPGHLVRGRIDLLGVSPERLLQGGLHHSAKGLFVLLDCVHPPYFISKQRNRIHREKQRKGFIEAEKRIHINPLQHRRCKQATGRDDLLPSVQVCSSSMFPDQVQQHRALDTIIEESVKTATAVHASDRLVSCFACLQSSHVSKFGKNKKNVKIKQNKDGKNKTKQEIRVVATRTGSFTE